MGKKILVTGSNGLLGQKLCSLIEAKGAFELIATARGENRNNYLKSPFYALDTTDKNAVEAVIQKTQPDIVINTAAMTNVDGCEDDKEGCWKANVDAVDYLVQACEMINAFFIHISTDFIFDGTAGPYKEDDAPNPLSYYGESKLASEAIVKNSKTDWAIARTVLVYGKNPGVKRSNIILWVKNSLEEGKHINVVNDQWRMPTLVEDLAMGCYLIAEKRATGVFNISGGDMLTPYDIAIKTADFFKLDKSLISETDGTKFQQKAKRPAKTGFILDKAREKLNYRPHTFEEGLEVLSKQLND